MDRVYAFTGDMSLKSKALEGTLTKNLARLAGIEPLTAYRVEGTAVVE